MALKPFNLREYIAEEKELKTIEVLGRTLSYGVLTVADSIEIGKLTDANEKAVQTVLCSLRKADPSVTRESILELGETAFILIAQMISAAEDFRVKGLMASCSTTEMPKA